MAAINGHIALTALLAALAGGLNPPPANWSEIDIQTPASPPLMLDNQGYLAESDASSVRKKIAPADFFRIVEIAPRAVRSTDVLKSPPDGALLHIRTSDGQDYYFAAGQGPIKDGNAQEIWTILGKYRGGSR